MLRIDGDVQFPSTFEVADLAALPDQIADVGVIVSGRAGGAVRLRALLARVAVADGATHLTITSSDGRFSASVPLAAVREAVLVYRLDGAPLPAAQGGPLRFLIPAATACGIEGVDTCANVKAVGHLRVTCGAVGDTRPSRD